MMGDRPIREPNELVIWGASSLLAALVGIGAAFGLWMQLGRTAHPGLLTASVVSLSVGLGLVGVAIRPPLLRTCLAVAGGTMILAYLLASPVFALFGL